MILVAILLSDCLDQSMSSQRGIERDRKCPPQRVDLDCMLDDSRSDFLPDR